MATPPLRSALSDTYPNPSNSVMRTGMGALWDYVTTLLGATGTPAAARAALGFGGGQLSGLRNIIINGGFAINQRAYVSGAAVGANLYGHDRWKMAASGDTYTFSTTANKTTITIPTAKLLRQVIEGLNLQTGTYCLSWEGTAQGKIGAGALSASGVTGAITGGTDTTIEFGPGTVANVQFEFGSVATPFEHRPYGLERALCQRYFWKTFGQSIAPRDNGGGGDVCTVVMVSVAGTPSYMDSIYFDVPMRTTPTITVYNPNSATPNTARVFTSAGAVSNATLTLAQSSETHVDFYTNTGTAYTLAYYALTAAAEL